MKLTKQIARKIIFPLIVGAGLEKTLNKKSAHSITNILYHGVVKKDSTFFTLRHIQAEQFEKHLRYFSKNFEVISLNEAFDRYRNGVKSSRKAITISFDDGYQNNLNIALPLLEKYKMKATFFISSVITNNDSQAILYADVIDAVNYFYRDQQIDIDGLTFRNGKLIESNIPVLEYLKGINPSERDKILNSIVSKYQINAKINQIPEEIWKLLSKDELRQLSSSDIVSIGSHGHLHYNLGLIKLKDAQEELKKSKDLLEEATSKNVNMIAYPDGCYTKDVKNLAEGLGYDKQLAVRYRCDDDLQDLRILERHGVSSTTTYESNIIFINKAFSSCGFN
ncbi:MAG: polysaccharide deacetylase family protein [Bacteroidales bacterium]|nr:polysaccharide deacetylase family protein [Bacteroidales bacterium]